MPELDEAMAQKPTMFTFLAGEWCVHCLGLKLVGTSYCPYVSVQIWLDCPGMHILNLRGGLRVDQGTVAPLRFKKFRQ